MTSNHDLSISRCFKFQVKGYLNAFIKIWSELQNLIKNLISKLCLKTNKSHAKFHEVQHFHEVECPGGGGGGGGGGILSTIYDHSKSNLHILDAKRNENHTCTKRKLLCSNDVSQ